MVRPSKSPVTTPFGKVPGYPLNDGFHKGVDFAYIPDNVIYAAEGGVVHLNTNDGTLGRSIHMYVGNHHHAYGHTSKYLVTDGQTVSEDQPIAIMGNTGAADGVHLHWALAVDGVLVNGLDYVTKKEGNTMYPNIGDLTNFHNRTGWGGDMGPNLIAYWTTGTGNPSWSKGADQVWKDLMYEVTEFVLKKPAPPPANATKLGKGIYEVS